MVLIKFVFFMVSWWVKVGIGELMEKRFVERLMAHLGHVLEEESSLVFFNFEEIPCFGEDRKSEKGFSKSSQPIKNPFFHLFLGLHFPHQIL